MTPHRTASSPRHDEPTAPPSAASARCRFLATAVAAVAVLLGGPPARAAELDRPVTATWTGATLRDWADRATTLAGMPVLVDPRLDPETVVTLDCRDEPIRAVLVRAAAAAGGELACLRSTARLTAPSTAAPLERAEAVRERRIATLPPRRRTALATRRPWAWSAGARPRDLVAGVAAEAGIALANMEHVPHDHLPAASLPPLSLAERIDLVLAGYDLRAEWSADAGRIVPLSSGPPEIETTADDRTDAAPPSRPVVKKPPRRPAAAAEPTFSLAVAAPLEQVLATIAARLGLELAIDQESLRRRGIAAAEIVRTQVKDATRDQLLDALLTPLGLSWEIDDGGLRVFARE
ncbi:MAG: hypothetical protein RLZZ111_1309 [Planctomycetota bacterium]